MNNNKYIKINPVKNYKDIYTIFNKRSNEIIGYISTDRAKKEICFSTIANGTTIWNTECLNFALHFIEEQFSNTNFTNHQKIEFIVIPTKTKTQKYRMKDNRGEVKWHGAWRQYCLFVDAAKIIYRDELKMIIQFIKDLNIKKTKQKEIRN